MALKLRFLNLQTRRQNYHVMHHQSKLHSERGAPYLFNFIVDGYFLRD